MIYRDSRSKHFSFQMPAQRQKEGAYKGVGGFPEKTIQNEDMFLAARIDSIDSTTQRHNELNKPNKLNKRSQRPRRLKSIRKSDPQAPS